MMVSLVILSFNRPAEIIRNVREIFHDLDKEIEIIVIDNNSEIPVSDLILKEFPSVRTIRMQENVGIAGRNLGIKEASGDYVITLDDDVFGFDGDDVNKIVSLFEACPNLAAINFRIIDDLTENPVNWIHHRELKEWVDKSFSTYEISEGACAFRKSAFLKVGGYPDYFFISHEGPDLALRLMDAGFYVMYYPDIVVRHAHSKVARLSWRRYYFDTRNLIWLAVRNLPPSLFIKVVFIGLAAQFLYSLRDGYIIFWFKGVRDGLIKINDVRKDRKPISSKTIDMYHEIKANNIGHFANFKKRILTKKGIRI